MQGWERPEKGAWKVKNKIIKETLKGVVFGMIVVSMFFLAAGMHAAGADTELPREYIRYCEKAG